ncbi:hypothetical protein [Nonomuraea rubra]|uniref:hypothetical protein n=1 Tax=Nonomuraea rubra TaxID=46180 RepID=UPI0033F0B508
MMPPPTDSVPSTAVLTPAQRTPCQPRRVDHDHVEGVCIAADVAPPSGQLEWRSPAATLPRSKAVTS